MTAELFRMDRRSTFGFLVGAAASTGVRGQGLSTIELPDPQARVESYVRMRNRLDGLPTYMPYRATIFGKPEGMPAQPLFDVEGFSWSRSTALGDGRYRLDSVEAGYFLDLASGEPLSKWTNPLNGRETTVKHYRSWSHLIASKQGLEPVFDPPVTGAVFAAHVGGPTVIADKVWMHEDLIGQIPNRSRESFTDPLEYIGPVVTATSLATWSADLAVLSDRTRAFVPVTLSYQTLGSWRPFMRMGLAPGVISWRMFGVKQASVEGVPHALLKRVLSDYPDFLTKLSAG